MRVSDRSRPGPSRFRLLLVLAAAVLLGPGNLTADPTLSTDPLLPFSTLLGGSAHEDACTVGLGPDGVVWVAVRTFSTDFPGARRPKRERYTGEVVVTRLDPGGRTILSTVRVGSDWIPSAFAFDAGGDAFLIGSTDLFGAYRPSGAPGAFPGDPPLTGMFLLRFRATDGGVAWTRVLGGSGLDVPTGIVVTPEGDPVVVGQTTSPDFPLAFPIQPTLRGDRDAFVMRVPGDGTGLRFSTFLGGVARDGATSVSLTSEGSLLVTGYTGAWGFPGAEFLAGTPPVEDGAFIAELDAEGATLLRTTQFGGLGIHGSSMDAEGHLLLWGIHWGNLQEGIPLPVGIFGTVDEGRMGTWLLRLAAPEGPVLAASFVPDFLGAFATPAQDGLFWMAGRGGLEEPLAGAARPYPGRGPGVSVMAFSSGDLSRTYATFLGGDTGDQVEGIVPGGDGSAWIAGITWSSDFPLSEAIQEGPPDGSMVTSMAFLSRLRAGDPDSMPAAPTGLMATLLEDGTIRLTWETPSDDVSRFAIYRHERDALAGFGRWGGRYGVRRIAVAPAGAREWIDQAVASNRSYSWTVQAINDRSASAPSPVAELDLPPTLGATIERGDLRYRRWHLRLRLRGRFSAMQGTAGGELDPRGGFELAFNSEGWPEAWFAIPAGDPGWRKSGSRHVWKGRGSRLSFDSRTGAYDLRIAAGSGLWFEHGTVLFQVTVGHRSVLLQAPWRGVKGSYVPGDLALHYRIP